MSAPATWNIDPQMRAFFEQHRIFLPAGLRAIVADGAKHRLPAAGGRAVSYFTQTISGRNYVVLALPDGSEVSLPPDLPGRAVPTPKKSNGSGEIDNKVVKVKATNVTEIKPSPEKKAIIDAAALLGEVSAYLARFVAYPSEHARVAHALWIAHAHAMNSWESTPRIAFLSPEPGSGKTRSLELTATLVPRPVESVNATPAYLFRKVADPEGPPVVLYDEIDTLFGPKAKDNEEVRGLLNAGHRRGAMAGRCVTVGKRIETEELPAYCAVALAGLGALPDTIMSRSIVVRMRRRAPGEHVEPYRRRVHAPEGNVLRDRLAAWAALAGARLAEARPEMPRGIEDRDADVWESLLAIADDAGGDWPARARAAAVALVAEGKATSPSLGVRLLADLRTVFAGRQEMFTTDIITALVAMEEAPWGDLKGKPIDDRRLARYLRPYSVVSRDVRLGERVLKGYRAEDLHDAWQRYLLPAETATSSPATPSARCTRCAGEGCAWCEVHIQPEGQRP